MATEKPRFTITMDEDLLGAVDDYKFENRIKNQSKAIVQLVRVALEELDRKGTDEIKRASASAEADTRAIGDSTIEVFRDVLGRIGFLDKNQDLSDNDLEFLKAMFLALKAHFKKGDK